MPSSPRPAQESHSPRDGQGDDLALFEERHADARQIRERQLLLQQFKLARRKTGRGRVEPHQRLKSDLARHRRPSSHGIIPSGSESRSAVTATGSMCMLSSPVAPLPGRSPNPLSSTTAAPVVTVASSSQNLRSRQLHPPATFSRPLSFSMGVAARLFQESLPSVSEPRHPALHRRGCRAPSASHSSCRRWAASGSSALFHSRLPRAVEDRGCAAQRTGVARNVGGRIGLKRRQLRLERALRQPAPLQVDATLLGSPTQQAIQISAAPVYPCVTHPHVTAPRCHQLKVACRHGAVGPLTGGRHRGHRRPGLRLLLRRLQQPSHPIERDASSVRASPVESCINGRSCPGAKRSPQAASPPHRSARGCRRPPSRCCLRCAVGPANPAAPRPSQAP